MKKNFNSSIILNKKFDIELSGYNAKQVDQYLDKIILDYKAFEEEIQTLEDKLEEKMVVINLKDDEIEKLNLEIVNLNDQITNINQNSSPELVKEISELRMQIKSLTKNISRK